MRKLASIQQINSKKSIPDADSIECIGILGWECVSKKNEFHVGEKCVYFEIDSLLPEVPQFEFLRKSCYRNDLKKFRLKTIKLRGQLSQGLALPLGAFPELMNLEIGSDVTEILGIEKYEPPIPAQIQGDVRSFSWPISKTDETRIQSDEEHGFIDRLKNNPYYITLKLDGTSSTFLIDPRDEDFHVCGRNYSYKENKNHSFWKINYKYDIENNLRKLLKENKNIAIQGECVGPGIQKNPLGLPCIDFFVFNVVDVLKNKFLCLEEAQEIVKKLNLKFVNILEVGKKFSYTKEDLLEKSKGKYKDFFPSAKSSQEMEGIVVRSVCPGISFKVINNNFLLKGG